MMGKHMQYAAWLGLWMPKLNDNASAAVVKKAAENVKGVRQVAVYPDAHMAAIYFDPIAAGDATTAEVIRVLAEAGFEVRPN